MITDIPETYLPCLHLREKQDKKLSLFCMEHLHWRRNYGGEIRAVTVIFLN